MKLIFLFMLMCGVAFGQGNLIFTADSCESQDSITIDLEYDTEVIQSEYGFVQQEARAIAMNRYGTWTNDSLQVYAAPHPDSTYNPVYYEQGLVYLIGSTGSDYLAFDPKTFAGIRYLMLVMPANEGDTRYYNLVRRRY